jgi:universal stress protein E
MNFKRILVYLDTRTLPADAVVLPGLLDLARLARAHSARITYCDVVEPPPRSGEVSAHDERLGKLRLRHARQTLLRLAAQVQTEGEVDCIALEGNAFLEIARLCLRERFDLVSCVGARESGNRMLSTANHLVRKAPAAVWLTGLRRPRPRGRIAVAVDRDIFPASDFPQEMARHLLEVASAVAGEEGVDIVLVHAWEVYGAELVTDPEAGLDPRALADYVDAQRYSHTLWLDELHLRLRALLEDAGISRVGTCARLLEGSASEVIPGWLESSAPDLLILGTVGTSATPGLYIGDVAETIIAATPVPVLAIKPPGFRSPVLA